MIQNSSQDLVEMKKENDTPPSPHCSHVFWQNGWSRLYDKTLENTSFSLDSSKLSYVFLRIAKTINTNKTSK